MAADDILQAIQYRGLVLIVVRESSQVMDNFLCQSHWTRILGKGDATHTQPSLKIGLAHGGGQALGAIDDDLDKQCFCSTSASHASAAHLSISPTYDSFGS